MTTVQTCGTDHPHEPHEYGTPHGPADCPGLDPDRRRMHASHQRAAALEAINRAETLARAAEEIDQQGSAHNPTHESASRKRDEARLWAQIGHARAALAQSLRPLP